MEYTKSILDYVGILYVQSHSNKELILTHIKKYYPHLKEQYICLKCYNVFS